MSMSYRFVRRSDGENEELGHVTATLALALPDMLPGSPIVARHEVVAMLLLARLMKAGGSKLEALSESEVKETLAHHAKQDTVDRFKRMVDVVFRHWTFEAGWMSSRQH